VFAYEDLTRKARRHISLSSSRSQKNPSIASFGLQESEAIDGKDALSHLLDPLTCGRRRSGGSGTRPASSRSRPRSSPKGVWRRRHAPEGCPTRKTPHVPRRSRSISRSSQMDGVCRPAGNGPFECQLAGTPVNSASGCQCYWKCQFHDRDLARAPRHGRRARLHQRHHLARSADSHQCVLANNHLGQLDTSFTDDRRQRHLRSQRHLGRQLHHPRRLHIKRPPGQHHGDPNAPQHHPHHHRPDARQANARQANPHLNRDHHRRYRSSHPHRGDAPHPHQHRDHHRRDPVAHQHRHRHGLGQRRPRRHPRHRRPRRRRLGPHGHADRDQRLHDHVQRRRGHRDADADEPGGDSRDGGDGDGDGDVAAARGGRRGDDSGVVGERAGCCRHHAGARRARGDYRVLWDHDCYRVTGTVFFLAIFCFVTECPDNILRQFRPGGGRAVDGIELSLRRLPARG
ncbi:hypothetical protein QBC39DRAFT_398055, partial [Podospora conica]